MNSIDELDELTLLYGKPINFRDICLLYPLTVGDIAQMGKTKFYQYLYLLISDPRETYHIDNEKLTRFIFLFIQSSLSNDFYKMIKEAFQLFIHEDVQLLPDIEILQIGELKDGKTMTADDYEEFIKFLCKIYRVPLPQASNPSSDKAKQIAEKLRRGREEVQKIKAKKGTDDDVDIDSLVSGLGLYYQNINAVWQLPYYTFFDQISRLQMRQSYDSNIMFTAAGAKIPKDKMKYWIRKVQDSKGG